MSRFDRTDGMYMSRAVRVGDMRLVAKAWGEVSETVTTGSPLRKNAVAAEVLYGTVSLVNGDTVELDPVDGSVGGRWRTRRDRAYAAEALMGAVVWWMRPSLKGRLWGVVVETGIGLHGLGVQRGQVEANDNRPSETISALWIEWVEWAKPEGE